MASRSAVSKSGLLSAQPPSLNAAFSLLSPSLGSSSSSAVASLSLPPLSLPSSSSGSAGSSAPSSTSHFPAFPSCGSSSSSSLSSSPPLLLLSSRAADLPPFRAPAFSRSCSALGCEAREGAEEGRRRCLRRKACEAARQSQASRGKEAERTWDARASEKWRALLSCASKAVSMS
eukprot:2878197-Rhodomonas_salina.2